MATRVNVDVVPKLARPAEVEQAIKAAAQMRERARLAAEAVAAAQGRVDELEHEDVEQAAKRARAGEPLGATSRALTKGRDTLLLAQRDSNALRLAQEQIEDELATAMQETASSWIASLDDETARARQQASEALAAYEAALAAIAASTAAALWVRSAVADGRWDRPQRQALDGTVARSSGRVSANSQPFGAAQIVGWAHELVEPASTSTPAQTIPPDAIVVTT
jgi:hypothetical protein